VDLRRPALRLVLLFGAVAIPPLVAFALIIVAAPDFVSQAGIGTVLLLVAVGAGVWAAVVAVVGSRGIARDIRELVELAERGVPAAEVTPDALTDAQRRMTSTLDERNRQISSLAAAFGAMPITGTALEVAASIVSTARRVTGDPTWQLAVFRAAGDNLLPDGLYTADPSVPPEPLGDLHRWAASAEPPGGAMDRRARHVDGPWGGFVVVDCSAGDELSAALLALWEGRAEPTPSDLDLFGLMGLQAATAIDHALLYARVRTQADELNRMAAIQTDFLRGVTHDLQSPLTSIRAVAAELSRADDLDEAARADLDTIAYQADRLRRMVSQLLVASRLEVGAVEPITDVLRIKPVVEQTWNALRAERTFEVHDDGPPVLVVADPDRLEQVLWAVMDNAVKYSQPASTIMVRITARSVDAAGEQFTVQVDVTDEGAGMDPTTQTRAFDQFFRAADARRLAPDGSGVGLYAARGLMRAMGGDIELASRLGVGTTVTLTLPAEAAGDANEPTAISTPGEHRTGADPD
jgi:signal transduction histidine kinase